MAQYQAELDKAAAAPLPDEGELSLFFHFSTSRGFAADRNFSTPSSLCRRRRPLSYILMSLATGHAKILDLVNFRSFFSFVSLYYV